MEAPRLLSAGRSEMRRGQIPLLQGSLGSSQSLCSQSQPSTKSDLPSQVARPEDVSAVSRSLGGEDILLASHSLFLSTLAVFIPFERRFIVVSLNIRCHADIILLVNFQKDA